MSACVSEWVIRWVVGYLLDCYDYQQSTCGDKNVLITFFTVLVTIYETLHYHDIVHCLQGFETHVSCLPLSVAGWGSPRGAKQPSNTNMPGLDNIYHVLLISAHSLLSSAKKF